ncbi:hypothetical protein H0X48_03735 [Candidatus Dependentiae bacterium]|nr:hypothetical protein [Candidatus Dependentiae bacterium]
MGALQRVTGILKVLGLCAVGTAGAYGVKRLLRPCTLTITFDICIATESRTALKNSITPEVLIKQRASGLQQELAKLFPALRALSIAYDASGRARVAIKAYTPLLQVISHKPQDNTKGYCIASNGKLVPSVLFKPEALAGLPALYVVSYGVLDACIGSIEKELLPLLSTSIVASLFNNYTVTWHSKNKLTLVSYTHPKVTIIADCSALKTKKLGYAERIYKSMQKEGAITVDIRLGDFIVCAHLKGGGI